MTATLPASNALAYRRTAADMMNDPDLTGDVLLLALALLHQHHDGITKAADTWAGVSRHLGWSTSAYGDLWRAVAKDLPRYESTGDRSSLRCSAAMIRRDGLCNRDPQPSLIMHDRDPQTGAGHLVGFCSRHGVMQHDIRSRVRQWNENGRPEPPHNAGGALARYFDGLAPLYRWANHGRDLTPGSGKPLAAAPRPKLTVIRGGAR